MIDIEADIFNEVYQKLSNQFPNLYIINEIIMVPPQLPCVCIEEISNVTAQRYIDSSFDEKYANLDYEVRVYTNNTAGKRRTARQIMAVADEYFTHKGFYRINPNQISFDDGTKYQMINRYTCTASKTTIYGR